MAITTTQQKDLSNLFSLLKSSSKVVGGCTQIEKFEEQMISTFGYKELSQIEKHERYIDIGSAVTLSDLLAMGQKHMPQILYEALQSIANPIIRNMATIGGNICAEGYRYTLFAPLLALDTKLEFRNKTETKIISLSNFTTVPDDFILTRIRIANHDAGLSVFRRIGPEHIITQQSASYAFLTTTGKKSIENIRIAFAGNFVFRDKEFENTLIGRRLPLSKKDVDEIMERINIRFQEVTADQMVSDVMKQQFLNLARYSFEQLT